MTTPEGLIIAEILDPYKTKDPDNLSYHKFNKARGHLPGQIRIRVRYKKYVTPRFDYLFVSKDELRVILEDTGWHIRSFINSHGPLYIAIMAK